MYGKHRILNNNFITTTLIDNDKLTASSQGDGIVSGTQKDGTGSATLQATGTYTGDKDLLYTVEVHDIDAGAEVGTALYRWRTSDTASLAWEATDVTTHNTYSTLSNGVDIKFTTGSGDDFVANDSWTFWAKAPWKPENMIDNDRGTSFRTDGFGDPSTIVIDLESATQVTAFVLYDHNISQYYDLIDVDSYELIDVDAAELRVGPSTIDLQGNASDSWGSPSYDQSLTIADPLVLYLDQTYRYWRLAIDDAGNNDFYVEIGEIYLGDYTEVTYNADWGSTQVSNFLTQGETNPYGILHRRVYAEQQLFTLNFNLMSNTEFTTFQTFVQTAYDTTNGKAIPFFWHMFQDENTMIYLVNLISPLPRNYRTVGYNDISLTLQEVVKANL
jgi:hypothetical protein